MANSSADYGILDVRMSQDNERCVFVLQSGIRVFTVSPAVNIIDIPHRLVGSVVLAEMFHGTDRIAYVREESPDMPSPHGNHTVHLLDVLTKRSRPVHRTPSRILNVRIIRSLLCICIVDQIKICTMGIVPRMLLEVATYSNSRGICVATISIMDRCLLAFPAADGPGRLQLMNLTSVFGPSELVSPETAPPLVIDAHQGELACAAFNSNGTMVATASARGTLIRVHDTTSGALLIELRRGCLPASIFSLNFSETSDFLCAASDTGTVHIFSVKDESLNTRGMLGTLGSWVGIDTQWSLAKFTVPAECKCECSFIGNGSVAALCVDGTIHRYSFSPDGQCQKVLHGVLIEPSVPAAQ